ncbi:hypothetical protein NHQ30_000788 [Ciborinia camelliae]|nr:hypothetical protein NHQ30_000788 [Ciborinia camelliae]
MCLLNHITYGCFIDCPTKTGSKIELERCGNYRDIANPSNELDRCSEKKAGQKISFKILRVRQRCPTCVTRAVTERVAERQEREEREKYAERRGERGEVLRCLRMEEDEDEGLLTPRPSAVQRAAEMPGSLDVDLAAEMRSRLKTEAGCQDVATTPKSMSGIAATPSMMLQGDTPTTFEGSPNLLVETQGTLGLGIYF